MNALLSPDLALLAGAVFSAGLLAGVLAGLLGIGGGIVVVPALYHVFGLIGVDDAVRMQMAVGTSLLTILPTSIRSLTSHNKRAAVDWAVLRRWVLPMAGGVLTGTAVARVVDGSVLAGVFAVMILAMAAKMAFGRTEWRLGPRMPGGWIERTYAGLSGFLSALMGIGGGIFGVSIMTLYAMPIHRAVATASGFGVIISLTGTPGMMLGGLGFDGRPPFSIGFVNPLAFAVLMPATLLSVPLGVRLAHGLSQRMLERAFAVFLVITSLSIVIDLLG